MMINVSWLDVSFNVRNPGKDLVVIDGGNAGYLFQIKRRAAGIEGAYSEDSAYARA